MTTALRRAMRLPLLERLEAAADLPATLSRLCEEHDKIYGALRAGAGGRAADLVEAHIRGFYSAATDEAHSSEARVG
jgi:DNA-binding GntR family transcriptional regulator